MRKFLVITIVLAMSSGAFAQLPMQYGGATVDGSLADWAGASWDAYDSVWTQGPSQAMNDFGSGEFAVSWTSSGLYVAARVTDNDHIFSASGYGSWNGVDFIEIYVDPCNEDVGTVIYNGLTGGAQYTMGRDNTPGDWSELNGPPLYEAMPGVYVTTISGADLIYEAFIPGMFQQGPRSDYKFGQEVGFESTMITKFGSAYATQWQGRHAGNGAPGPFGSGGWTTYTLVPEPFTMSLLGIGGLALMRRRKK